MEQKQVQKIQGEVEAAVQNTPARYGVKVGGIWYNGFGKVRVQRGAKVEVAYTTTENGYTNVEEIKVIEGNVVDEWNDLSDDGDSEVKSSGRDRDQRITKAVALKCAAVFYQHGRRPSYDAFFDWADRMEKWLNATSSAPQSLSVMKMKKMNYEMRNMRLHMEAEGGEAEVVPEVQGLLLVRRFP